MSKKKKSFWGVSAALAGAAAAVGAVVMAVRYLSIERYEDGTEVSFRLGDLKDDARDTWEAVKERFAPIPEGEGAPIDLDGDGVADAVVLDVDGDGTVDAVVADHDGDGIAEAAYIDTDGDGQFETVVVEAPETEA